MRIRRFVGASAIAAVVLLVLIVISVGAPLVSDAASPRVPAPLAEARRAVLGRAAVWTPPSVPIERAALRASDTATAELTCRFIPSELGGTTAKFDCLLPDGDEVRVKYRGPERVAEAIATRLLQTLGFGADDVTLVPRVRCFGCPVEPFISSRIASTLGVLTQYGRGIDYTRERTFDWAAIERKFPAPAIEIGREGWGWWEVAEASPPRGRSRAELDAFLLMAVFLAHWDNKMQNQRLVCLPGGGPADGRCQRPLALIHDAGATFGPRKMDLDGWRSAPIWEDRSTCTIGMGTLPYGGGTFRSVRISEEGRQLLAGLLSRLSTGQVVELFSSARAASEPHLSGEWSPEVWARLFVEKTRAIREGAACPPAGGDA